MLTCGGLRKCGSPQKAAVVSLDKAVRLPQLDESLDGVKLLCKEIVPGWKELPLDSLAVARVTGGITNVLFSVTPAPRHGSSQLEPVVVRIFGPETEKVIDRAKEFEAMQVLSDSGFGARLIGTFCNGTVQSFLRGKTLTVEEMASPSMIPRIAATLSRLHSLRVPGPQEPQLWLTILKYLDAASSLVFEDQKKQAVYQTIDFRSLRADILDLQGVSDALKAPLVFAHNDLLSGNIMYDSTTDDLHFIDFEYAAYSFRGYDIANHFCEYAGFECDYSRYPDKDTQFLFFRHYLSPTSPEEVSESSLESLHREVSMYALASHLYWGVWAIIQARFSPIEFNYMGYFFLRHKEFLRLKAQLPSFRLDC